MADEDVEYQRAGQVSQLRAERVNAVAYGQETRVEAVDRQLADLGFDKKATKAEAAEKRAASATEDAADEKPAAEEKPKAHSPRGRQPKPQARA